MAPKARKTTATTTVATGTVVPEVTDKKVKNTETYGLTLQKSRVLSNMRHVTSVPAVLANNLKHRQLVSQLTKAKENLAANPTDTTLTAERDRLTGEISANRAVHKQISVDQLRIGKPSPIILTRVHENIVVDLLVYATRSVEPGTTTITVKSLFTNADRSKYPYIAFVENLPEYCYNLERETELERVRVAYNTKKAELSKLLTTELTALKEANKTLPEAELAVLVKKHRDAFHAAHPIEVDASADDESNDDDDDETVSTRFETYVKKIHDNLVANGTIPKITVLPRFYSFVSEVLVASIRRITNSVINNFIRSSFAEQVEHAEQHNEPKTINYSHVMQYVLTVMNHANFPVETVAAFETDCKSIISKTKELVETAKKIKTENLSAEEVAKAAADKLDADKKRKQQALEKHLKKAEELRGQLSGAPTTSVVATAPVVATTA